MTYSLYLQMVLELMFNALPIQTASDTVNSIQTCARCVTMVTGRPMTDVMIIAYLKMCSRAAMDAVDHCVNLKTIAMRF